MRIPGRIGFRITLGFGLLILAILFNAFLSHRIVTRIGITQQEQYKVLQPSLRLLVEMQSVLIQSKDMLQTWDYSGKDPDSPLLQQLQFNLQNRIPATHRQILQLSGGWRQRDNETYIDLYSYINDSLYFKTSRFTSDLFPAGQSDTLTVTDYRLDLQNVYQTTGTRLGELIGRFDRLAVQAQERTQIVYRQSMNVLLISGIGIAIAAIFIAVILFFSLVNPIRQYTDTISLMGKGIIPEKEFHEGADEIGQIGTALNQMIRGLRDLSEFAEEIGRRNFKSQFTPLSESDILGNSLIRLREDLQNAAIEEEKRKREDERRNWSNNGIARFNEILREFSGDLQTLSNKLISELVNYLGARVGGLFLKRTEESGADIIDLVASYAYDRTKHLQKTIEPGEGLIGRCIQESSTIFLTDIPPDYIKIKSGLGEDNPKSLLIVPIRLTDKIIGVVEIASLEMIQDFQIEFVERIGLTIASSLTGEHTGAPISPNKEVSDKQVSDSNPETTAD